MGTKSLSTGVVVKLGANDLSQFINTSEFNQTFDTEEVTGYGKLRKVYDPVLGDATFTMGGWYDSVAGGPRAILEPLQGTVQVLTYRPEGTGAGKPQAVVNVIIGAYVQSAPVAGHIQWTCNCQCSDTINYTVQ